MGGEWSPPVCFPPELLGGAQCSDSFPSWLPISREEVVPLLLLFCSLELHQSLLSALQIGVSATPLLPELARKSYSIWFCLFVTALAKGQGSDPGTHLVVHKQPSVTSAPGDLRPPLATKDSYTQMLHITACKHTHIHIKTKKYKIRKKAWWVGKYNRHTCLIITKQSRDW